MSSDEFGAFSYVRVPPDSTGKRTSAITTLAVDYTGGVVAFSLDTVVNGETSLLEGRIVRKSGTTSAGTIYVVVSSTSPVTTFTVGEVIKVNGVTHATVGAVTVLYTQTTGLAGGSNPLHVQNVSEAGSAFIRYSEGEQLIDAFGVSKSSQSEFVDQLLFTYGLNSSRFLDVSGGLASLSFLSNSNSVALDVDTGIGQYVSRQTNIYYPYHPGFGALTEMTVLCGDTGKAGVYRRWGRFDDNDGLYFEHSGTIMNVCIRSSTGGAVAVTKVSQSAWNVDNLSGEGGLTNPSTFTLDESKLNLYWIDYAWLGGGQVRFGVYSGNGQRIVAHRFENAGALTAPYMKNGNLPFKIEISNSQATASPSRVSLTCVSIKNDGSGLSVNNKFGYQRSYMNDTPVSASSDVWTPILTWRATPLIGSVVNRYLSVISSFAGYTSAPTAFKLYQFAAVNSGSWVQNSVSGLEFSVSSSQVLGGEIINSWFSEVSSSFDFKATDHATVNTTTHTKGNGAAGNIWVLAAQSMIPTVSSSVRARMTWTDFE